MLRLRLRQVPSVDRSLCLSLCEAFPTCQLYTQPPTTAFYSSPPEHFCIFMKRRQAEWLHCSEIKSINLPKHKVPVSYPYSLAPPLPSLPSSCCCCCYWLTHPSCHDFHERLLSLSNRAINQNDLNFMPRSWREQSLAPPPVLCRQDEEEKAGGVAVGGNSTKTGVAYKTEVEA